MWSKFEACKVFICDTVRERRLQRKSKQQFQKRHGKVSWYVFLFHFFSLKRYFKYSVKVCQRCWELLLSLRLEIRFSQNLFAKLGPILARRSKLWWRLDLRMRLFTVPLCFLWNQNVDRKALSKVRVPFTVRHLCFQCSFRLTWSSNLRHCQQSRFLDVFCNEIACQRFTRSFEDIIYIMKWLINILFHFQQKSCNPHNSQILDKFMAPLTRIPSSKPGCCNWT